MYRIQRISRPNDLPTRRTNTQHLQNVVYYKNTFTSYVPSQVNWPQCFPEDLSPHTTHSTFWPLSVAEEPLCVDAAWLAGVEGSSSSSRQLPRNPSSRGGRSEALGGHRPGPPTPPYTSAPCVMMPVAVAGLKRGGARVCQGSRFRRD